MNIPASLLLAALSVFALPGDDRLPYNMDLPDKVVPLPETLHEISGIVNTPQSVACVQDENGIVFFYDHEKREVTRQVRFGPDGDYEDIAYDGKSYFVLRSDGVIFEIREEYPDSAIEHYTGVPAKNCEGLCFDSQRNALLIAVKGKLGKGKFHRDRRAVYVFDLKSRRLADEPLLMLNVQDMKQAAEKSGISLPVKYKKKGKVKEKVLKLALSAVAIHPVSRDIFLLSSTDRLLLIYDRDLKFKQMVALDPIRFNKAEGMTFTPDGELMVSNEGGSMTPTILLFSENRDNKK